MSSAHRSPPPRADDARKTPARGSRTRFFYVRVSILLFVLFLVGLYAIRDLRSRRARNEWERTLDVAIVLVRVGANEPVDPGAIQGLRDRKGALEERLRAEASRHRPGIVTPFRFRVFGPVDVDAPPPKAEDTGALDLAKHALALRRWLEAIDPRAGVDPAHWDSRIYVDARRPLSDMRSIVEGQSQLDGRIGVVTVELAPSMVDLTLFVVTHELMHTLGAEDQYDASGRTRIPDGLADPALAPLYPQRAAEIMARNRMISIAPWRETTPETLDELAVGAATARAIGWSL